MIDISWLSSVLTVSQFYLFTRFAPDILNPGNNIPFNRLCCTNQRGVVADEAGMVEFFCHEKQIRQTHLPYPQLERV